LLARQELTESDKNEEAAEQKNWLKRLFKVRAEQ